VRSSLLHVLPSSHSSLFDTGTNYTQPLPESNRSSRRTIFGWSIATQYSEIITPSCFYHHLIPVSFIQTLTTLNLNHNQIGAQGAQYLAEALRHNTVRSSPLHVFTIISLLSLSYRHSLHSTLTTIKSEIKVHNTWLKHCDTIQWDHHSFMFYHHLILLSLIQALTTLNLYRNQIEAQGAQYLAEALRHNTVRSSLLHVLPSSHSCLFHTDTHYTQLVVQSNRSSRCTIFRWRIATQYSEIITPSCFYHHLIPVSFIQTLTTLNLNDNQIEAQGAQYLAEALRHNTVRSSLLHVFTIISLLSLSYRHSLHSTFTAIKLELKVHNIWLKHCDTIQWDHHSFMFYHHLILFSLIQALTTLHLSNNQIGAQGAQYFERLKETNSHLTVLWWFKCRFQFSGVRLITNRWKWRDIHSYALACVCCISS